MNRHCHRSVHRFIHAAVPVGCTLLLSLYCNADERLQGKHVLAENGEAKAAIVIADRPDVTHLIDRVRSENAVDPKGTVEAWARALAFWLEKATGADFPIVKASRAPMDKLWILLGTSELSRKYGFDGSAADLEPEEARVRGFDKGLVIFGERVQANRHGAIFRTVRSIWNPRKTFDVDIYADRGVGHAVSIFLEKIVGCRFYYPYCERSHDNTEFSTWTYIPDRNRLEVPQSLSIVEAPVYLYRDGMIPIPTIEAPLKHGVPVGYLAFRWGCSEQLAVNHIYNVIRGDFPNRPELFAKHEDGEPMYDRRQGCPKCFAEPDLVDIYIEQVRYMDRTGKKNYSARKGGRRLAEPHRVLVGPSDATWVDCDPRSQKWYQPERNPVGSQSDLYFNFIAKLAKRVNEEWPGREVAAMAQNNYAEAPSERVELPDNVDVLTCISKRSSLMNAQKVYENYNTQFVDDWHRKLDTDRKRLALWDYPGRPQRWTAIPVWAPRVIQGWYRRNRDKMAGTFLNGGSGYPIALPIRVVWMRLLWNPDIDIEVFYQEFCSKMFGPASGDMFKVIMQCVERYETTQWAERAGVSSVHRGAAHSKIFPEHVVREIKRRFLNAWKQAGASDNPAYANRIKILYNEGGEYGMDAFFKASEKYHRNQLSPVDECTTTIFHRTFESGPDVTRETTFRGKGSLKLQGNGKSLRRPFELMLEPNRKYTLSAAMKRVGDFSKKKGDVQVALLNKAEKMHHLAHLHIHTKHDDEWHEDKATFMTGDKIGRIVFFVANSHSSGTVYLDELKLVTRTPLTAARVDGEAVNLDGQLNETVWKKTETYNLLEGANPLNLKPPRTWWKNDFRILFSEEALYVGIQVSGEGDMIAKASHAQDIYDDDHVSVIIDAGSGRTREPDLPDVADMKTPYAEKVLAEAKGRQYLSVNPNGVTDPTWLQVATDQTNPRMFTAEIKVPFEKVGIDPAKQNTFFIDVRRWVGPRPSLADPPKRFAFAGNEERRMKIALPRK